MDEKFAYHPKTGKIIDCGVYASHAQHIKQDFDNWVRAIYFKEKKRVYFRFFLPSGDFAFVTDEERAKSFDVCYDAKEALIKAGVIPKRTKILYWTTDREVSEFDIRY